MPRSPARLVLLLAEGRVAAKDGLKQETHPLAVTITVGQN